jgi:hypothetical protein
MHRVPVTEAVSVVIANEGMPCVLVQGFQLHGELQDLFASPQVSAACLFSVPLPLGQESRRILDS